MRRLKPGLLAILAFFAAEATADWYVTDASPQSRRIRISWLPYDFQLGKLSCGATEMKWFQMPDKSIVQSRELFCQLTGGARVAVTVICEPPDPNAVMLKIAQDGISYTPVLGCESEDD